MNLTDEEVELVNKWRNLPAKARENVIKVMDIFAELIRSQKEKKNEYRL